MVSIQPKDLEGLKAGNSARGNGRWRVENIDEGLIYVFVYLPFRMLFTILIDRATSNFESG